MAFTAELKEELEILAMFNLSTTQEGIKIHSDARSELVVAAQRLHNKSLISQPDGGYLTGLGHDAAEHAQALLTILK